MAGVARIPRRRGSLCGLLLIILGVWGGLAPFVGPYFHFGLQPDHAWHYNDGRLYLSVIPGAVALVAGLAIMATRSRALGIVAGLLATLAGAWFAFGVPVTQIVLHRASIAPGAPLVPANPPLAAATWIFLEEVGVFTGVGVLIVLLGGLAMGRFSMLAATDTPDDDFDEGLDSDADLPDTATTAPYSAPASPFSSPSGSFTPSTRPFPGEEPTQTQDPVRFATGEMPAVRPGPFPPAAPPSPFQPSGQD
jgi:hypothetical protein